MSVFAHIVACMREELVLCTFLFMKDTYQLLLMDNVNENSVPTLFIMLTKSLDIETLGRHK